MPSVEALSESETTRYRDASPDFTKTLTLFSLPSKRGLSFVNSLATEIVGWTNLLPVLVCRIYQIDDHLKAYNSDCYIKHDTPFFTGRR